jgi:hypothetical protein
MTMHPEMAYLLRKLARLERRETLLRQLLELLTCTTP